MGKIQKNDPSQKKLQILDTQGRTTHTLAIDNLYSIVTLPEQIGKRFHEKNYLLKPRDQIETKIAQLRTRGMSDQAIAKEITQNSDFYQEMPANYAQPYTYRGDRIFSEGKLSPAQSQNKFHVQYQDITLAGQGTIHVTLKTGKESATIALFEITPGVFQSKDLLLVSCKEFDQYPVNGPDNSETDQTFHAALNEKVKISYTDPSGETHTTSASIPVEQVVELKLTVLKDENGQPLATPEQIAQQIARMQESYASAGMQIKILEPIQYMDFPPGLSAKDGLNEEKARKIEEYLREKGHTTSDHINLIFSGDNFVEDFSKKDAVTFFHPEPGSSSLPTTYNILVKSTPLIASSGAHELGHALALSAANGDATKLQAAGYSIKDDYSHHPNRANLMFARQELGEKNIFGSEHLTETQIHLIKQSPYAKNPISPKPFEGLRSIPAIHF
ncbi:MAG: hypothetical protein K1X66_00945 [Verrucomicrobiae bacterium]|nr:hypothetical protein [Verrucomicrobiae bacterium]